MSEEYKTVHMRYDKYVEMCGEICDLRNLCSDYRGTLASAGAYQQELEEQIAKIVHCKDCKHFYQYGEKWGVCEYTRKHQEKALDVSPEHFCGWGEKK